MQVRGPEFHETADPARWVGGGGRRGEEEAGFEDDGVFGLGGYVGG